MEAYCEGIENYQGVWKSEEEKKPIKKKSKICQH